MMPRKTMIRFLLTLSDDYFDNEFNNWLGKNGLFIALGVAFLVLVIICIIFALSKKKNR